MSGWLEAATPVNDHFTNATEIVLPVTYSFTTNLVSSNEGATVEPGESLNPDLATAGIYGTIWFRWTCPVSGAFTMNVYGETCAIAAGRFIGSSVSNLTTLDPPMWDGFGSPIFGHEELGGTWIWSQAVAGVTYWFAVMSESSEHGPCDDGAIHLDITYSPLVVQTNDHFVDRIILSGTNTAIGGDTRGSSVEPGEPVDGIASSVWYSWTAPTSGVVQASFITSSGACPAFRAFHGNSVEGLTPAAPTPTGGFYVMTGDILAIQVAVPTTEVCGFASSFTMTLWVEPPTAASPNDDFDNRAPIGTTPEYQFVGSLYGASSQAGEPLADNNAPRTLWWTFTPPADGVLKVMPSSQHVWLHTQFFEGNALGSLLLLPQMASQTGAYRLEAGHTYSLQLSSETVPAGAFSLATRFYPALTNDAFANSVLLAVGTNISISEWLLEASLEPGEPLPVPNLGKSLWWSWNSPVHGKITLTGGAAPIRAVNVYTGDALGGIEWVPVRLMPNGNVFTAEAGRTYHFQLMAGDTDTGPFQLNIAFHEFGPPATDDFANARRLQDAGDGTFESIVCATRELGEPDHIPGVPHQSIWWSIAPPINGQVALDGTGGSYLGAVFVVYQGAGVDNLQPIARGTNYVDFPAYGGETYYVAAATPIGAIGDIRLAVAAISRNTGSRVIPGNLVQNYSFEELVGLSPIARWEHTNEIGGLAYPPQNAPPAADGVHCPVVLGQSIYQDLVTIPGEPYRIRFAVRNWSPTTGAVVQVTFGSEALPDAVSLIPQWRWFEHVAIAQGGSTRLRITFSGDSAGLDAVSVVRDSEPPAFVSPLQSLSALEGSTAYFHAGVSGSVPLWYQWFFNEVPLPDNHGSTLLIQPVTTDRVGTYQLVVTNRAGAITSAPVQLTLESPTSPEILVQPHGDSVLLDQYFVLGVLAAGTPPLAYQWFRNGTAMEDATNRHLVMTNILADDLASYSVMVSNVLGSVMSLPASLTLAMATTNSGAQFIFDAYSLTNSLTPRVTVRDLDGVTLLEGPSYVAQLYLGPSAEQLRPVTAPSPFFSYYHPGTWRRVTVYLQNFSTNTPYAAQIRVWEQSAGETYEEARAAGGKFGRSVPFTITAKPLDWMALPESSIPSLPSFSLEAGRPGFNVGKLEWVERGLDGTAVWQLTGDPGFRYVVEKSNDSLRWQPFQILTNSTGTMRFTDPTAANANQSWYRSRILD